MVSVASRLGTVEGLAKGSVHAFLGLRYATLKDKFAAPVLNESSANADIDATAFGPTAVQNPHAVNFESGHLQLPIPNEGSYPYSETESLSLNIFAPASQATGSLPVLVFVHGGGFAIGSSRWPQYDLSLLVKRASDLGSPFLGVTINYRLGVFGFLHSKDLTAAGYPANRGLLDQRVALKWIKLNISAFGGDPTRVTFAGESAGGVSGTLHLESEDPLFSQYISMGGTSLLLKPIPPPVADFAYKTVLSAVGLDNLASAEDRVQGLLRTTAEEFIAKVGPGIPLLPVVDGSVVKQPASFEAWTPKNVATSLPGLSWCKRVLTGDCQFDGSILANAVTKRENGLAAEFRASLGRSLAVHPGEAGQLSAAYGITSETTDNEAKTRVLEFFTDIGFYAPAVKVAEAWGSNGFVYHFNEPTLGDGPNKGKAVHILDIAYLTQNLNEALNAQQQSTAIKMADDFIRFVSGQDPFPDRTDASSGARVYGPPAKGGVEFIVREKPEDLGRRRVIWEASQRVGLDALSNTFSAFLAGY